MRRASGELLVVRRPEGGLWGGLWEFPRTTKEENETPEEAAIRAAAEHAGVSVKPTGKVLGTVRHGVTTYKITLLGFECHSTDSAVPVPPPGWAAAYVTSEVLHTYALASPQVRLLAQIEAHQTQPSLF